MAMYKYSRGVEPGTTLISSPEPLPPGHAASLLSMYKDVFKGLGHITQVSFLIDDKCAPIQHAPQHEVKEKMADLEEKGIIEEETEPTDWISSMMVVANPNKIRICLDRKDLNKALKRPNYQMATLDELLLKLNNQKVFTVEALLMDPLISRQLYLRPLYLRARFKVTSHLLSPKQPFFLIRQNLNQSFYIAVTKEKYRNLKRWPSYLEKAYFQIKLIESIKVNNLVNGQDSRGNFRGEHSSLITYFMYLTKSPRGSSAR